MDGSLSGSKISVEWKELSVVFNLCLIQCLTILKGR